MLSPANRMSATRPRPKAPRGLARSSQAQVKSLPAAQRRSMAAASGTVAARCSVVSAQAPGRRTARSTAKRMIPLIPAAQAAIAARGLRLTERVHLEGAERDKQMTIYDVSRVAP